MQEMLAITTTIPSSAVPVGPSQLSSRVTASAFAWARRLVRAPLAIKKFEASDMDIPLPAVIDAVFSHA